MQRMLARIGGNLRATLREFYFGRTRRASVFQGMMLCLDLLTLAYFLVTTFVHGAPWLRVVDVALGLVLLLEFGGRVLATKHPMEYLESTVAIVDMLVIASLLAAVLIDNHFMGSCSRPVLWYHREEMVA